MLQRVLVRGDRCIVTSVTGTIDVDSPRRAKSEQEALEGFGIVLGRRVGDVAVQVPSTTTRGSSSCRRRPAPSIPRVPSDRAIASAGRWSPSVTSASCRLPDRPAPRSVSLPRRSSRRDRLVSLPIGHGQQRRGESRVGMPGRRIDQAVSLAGRRPCARESTVRAPLMPAATMLIGTQIIRPYQPRPRIACRQQIAARGDRWIEQIHDRRRVVEVRRAPGDGPGAPVDVADGDRQRADVRDRGASGRTAGGPSIPAPRGARRRSARPGG